MVPLAGYAPAADHYQFLNVHLSKVSCSIQRVREYPVYIAKFLLFPSIIEPLEFPGIKTFCYNIAIMMDRERIAYFCI